jgi:hypothetical protein
MSASRRRHARPAPACAEFILQRFGGRPVRFAGHVIACSDDVAGPAWSRLRLAIYARDGGGYVSEILCQPMLARPAARIAPAWCHAALAGTLAVALGQFENAVAAEDDLAPADAPADAAVALFEAAGRLCRATAQTRALRHAVGHFLYCFCKEMTDAERSRLA